MTNHILDYLEQTAAKYPDRIAFADEHTACTYQELKKNSERIGTGLCRLISRNTPVPVFMEKSVQTIQVLMGIVRAGGFYVMLDIHQPSLRLQSILDILQADCLITSRMYEKELEQLGYSGIVLLAEELLQTEPEEKVL